MTTRKKYRLTKLSLDEISIVDAGADPNAVVTIFKRDTSGAQPGADDTRLSDPSADRIMSELVATIRKARELVGQIPVDMDPKRARGVEDAIRKLSDANKAAQITIRAAAARQAAEAVFKATGLSSLSDLRAEVAKAEALPDRIRSHIDQADLDTLRETRAKIDRPTHPVDRHNRKVNDALDEAVRARQSRTGQDYLAALDDELADRKRG